MSPPDELHEVHDALEALSPRERRRLNPRPPRDIEIRKMVNHPGGRLACQRPSCVAYRAGTN